MTDEVQHHSLPFPKRVQVEAKLMNLINDCCTREQAANWATSWALMEDLPVDDWGVWRALCAMALADTITADRPYLFDKADFTGWLKQLRTSDTEDKE